MKRLPYLLIALALIFVGEISTVQAATTITKVFNGGTGAGTFTSSQLLYGNGTNPLSSVATSTATCTAASGVGCTNFTIVGAGGTTIALSSIPNGSLANSSVSFSSSDSSLTVPASIALGASGSFVLNLAHANTWTALQQFNGAASSTLFSANQAQFGATATTTFGTDGKITGNDVANGFFGRISPTHEFLLPYATTTTLTGTSSATDISQMSSIDMDYSGIPRSVSCVSDGFPGIEVDKNGSPLSPSYFIASSTRGTITFTGSPTFVKGDVFSIKTGTTTTDTGFHYARCNVLITETP